MITPAAFDVLYPFRDTAWHGPQRSTYRAVYTVNFPDVVYVLHVFQKKSPSGKRMARVDIGQVRTRLKAARSHYEMQHGEARKGKA